VGTLADVGLSRRRPDDILGLLERPDRARAGMTAPSRGLTLVEVCWPQDRGSAVG
jgi:tRNA pseudouridine38-40 synthase